MVHSLLENLLPSYKVDTLQNYGHAHHPRLRASLIRYRIWCSTHRIKTWRRAHQESPTAQILTLRHHPREGNFSTPTHRLNRNYPRTSAATGVDLAAPFPSLEPNPHILPPSLPCVHAPPPPCWASSSSISELLDPSDSAPDNNRGGLTHPRERPREECEELLERRFSGALPPTYSVAWSDVRGGGGGGGTHYGKV